LYYRWWFWWCKTWWFVFRVISDPPRLVCGFDVSVARWVSAGRRSGIDASVVVGFQDSFAFFSVMREIPSVEPTVTVGFGGVMVGREGRASV
jgi:hypothetical protein